MRNYKLSNFIATVFFNLIGPISILLLLLIFAYLIYDSIPFFYDNEAWHSLLSFNWRPTSYQQPSFGVLSMFFSTLMLTLASMSISIPLGVASSLLIVFYLPFKLKSIVRITIELFSAIPSVIVGLIGVGVVAPVLMEIFHWKNTFNLLTTSILVGLMSLPTIISLSIDAIESVPKNLRFASLSLGASKLQTIFKVVLPAAKSGILTAVMLGMGRVIGETMIVLMVSGNSVAFPEGWTSPIRTFTSTIAIEMGEVAQSSVHYSALFTLALILFIFTFIINLISDSLIRFRRN